MNDISDSVYDIGYYKCVTRGASSIHVQTEILGETPPKIRTTVMKNGAVLHSVVQNYPVQNADVELAKAVAESQHKRILADVRQGKFD
jgi:hypothetical protein